MSDLSFVQGRSHEFDKSIDLICDESEKLDLSIQARLKDLEAALGLTADSLIAKVRLIRASLMKELNLHEQSCILYQRELSKVFFSMNRQASFSKTSSMPQKIKQIGLIKHTSHSNTPKHTDLIQFLAPETFSPAEMDSLIKSSVFVGFYPIPEPTPLPKKISISTAGVPNKILLANPHALSVDRRSGHLYLADQSHHRVLVLTPSLELVRIVDGSETPTKVFRNVSGVSVSPITGDFAAVEYDANQIHLFNKDGSFIRTIGSPGNEVGQFQGPTNIAYDLGGNFYVCDHENNRVQKFARDGDACVDWDKMKDTKISKPYGLTVNSLNQVLVVPQSGNTVYVLNESGVLMNRISVAQTSYNSLCRGPRGGFLMADYSGNVIHFYDSVGNKYHELAFEGPLGMQFGLDGAFYAVSHTQGLLAMCQ